MRSFGALLLAAGLGLFAAGIALPGVSVLEARRADRPVIVVEHPTSTTTTTSAPVEDPPTASAVSGAGETTPAVVPVPVVTAPTTPVTSAPESVPTCVFRNPLGLCVLVELPSR